MLFDEYLMKVFKYMLEAVIQFKHNNCIIV